MKLNSLFLYTRHCVVRFLLVAKQPLCALPSAPVVKIKQSLTKLKQEIVQMDVRIGVVQHTLLQAKLKEKSNMTRDMHATNIPEHAAAIATAAITMAAATSFT